MMDDCDPDDAGVGANGGLSTRNGGDVTTAEFGLFLRSPPLQQRRAGTPADARDCSSSATPRGAMSRHISWSKKARESTVKNEGGRLHTFTPVAEFGGGRVPPLLVGTLLAPECAAPAAARDRSLSKSPRATV